MKKTVVSIFFLVMLVCGINAQQVLQQATVAIIEGGNPGADPFLCVFGNRIEDVTLLDYHLNLDGKEVRYLREREEINLPLVFAREMTRLNARFLSIHTYQRRIVGNSLVTYWIVDIIERVGNKYFIIANNNY